MVGYDPITQNKIRINLDIGDPLGKKLMKIISNQNDVWVRSNAFEYIEGPNWYIVNSNPGHNTTFLKPLPICQAKYRRL
jgi:hypothetical protein